jgi:hypothetical protein
MAREVFTGSLATVSISTEIVSVRRELRQVLRSHYLFPYSEFDHFISWPIVTDLLTSGTSGSMVS